MPRNLILRYSNSGDWVLDQFMGSGTTLVEAKLLNRNAVGVDINPQSVSISETNLQFQCETNSKIFARNGNATNLHFIKDSRIDFICTHPPYANIIKYSKGIKGDISSLGVDEFLVEMCKVAKKGDFVFIDSPYAPLNPTSFESYTKEGFDIESHKRLAKLFDELTARGCCCMLTNHNTDLINELYSNKGYRIDVVSVKRMINSDASNRVGEEVIICNY